MYDQYSNLLKLKIVSVRYTCTYVYILEQMAFLKAAVDVPCINRI